MDRLFISPRFDQWWPSTGLKTVEAVVARFLPDKPRRQKVTVARVSFPEQERASAAFFKLYRHSRGWRFWLRRSKARIEFENYLTFHRLGVPAAEPIACGEERDAFGRLRRAFILTCAVPNARQLDEFFRSADHREQRRLVIEQLAKVVRRLHNADFFYYDLVWRNILVGDGEGAAPQVYLIDCPRGGVSRIGRGRKLLRDLASLDKTASQLCSRTERLRFLLRYLNEKTLDAKGKALLRACIEYRRRRWPEDWRGK